MKPVTNPAADIRGLFPGYFPPRETDIDDLWQRGLIVPDTNILLHVLRYGKKTRDEVLDSLKAFKSRIWVPYQVVYEFARNWQSVESENRNLYARLEKDLRKGGKALKDASTDVSRHQTLDIESEIAKIDQLVEALIQDAQQAAHKRLSYEEAERIVDEILNIISGSIGSAPTAEDLARLYATGAERFEKRVPPGYRDNAKGGDDRFGDFLIWEELITVAAERSVPVIFVTDDRKEDWILAVEGKRAGPRPELVNEFIARAHQRFWVYSLTEFLKRANKSQVAEVSEEAIAEVELEERLAEIEVSAREIGRMAESARLNASQALEDAVRAQTYSLNDDARRAEFMGSLPDGTFEARQKVLSDLMDGGNFTKTALDLAKQQHLRDAASFAMTAADLAKSQYLQEAAMMGSSFAKTAADLAKQRYFIDAVSVGLPFAAAAAELAERQHLYEAAMTGSSFIMTAADLSKQQSLLDAASVGSAIAMASDNSAKLGYLSDKAISGVPLAAMTAAELAAQQIGVEKLMSESGAAAKSKSSPLPPPNQDRERSPSGPAPQAEHQQGPNSPVPVPSQRKTDY